MDWFWNWGGECFGYREGDSVFTYFGKEAGRFDGEEIFGSNGRYLGEVMSDNLPEQHCDSIVPRVANCSKKSKVAVVSEV